MAHQALPKAACLREAERSDTLELAQVGTLFMEADALTKSTPRDILATFRRTVFGSDIES